MIYLEIETVWIKKQGKNVYLLRKERNIDKRFLVTAVNPIDEDLSISNQSLKFKSVENSIWREFYKLFNPPKNGK